MTYTNYPAFAPHTVLDWAEYSSPRIQLGPKFSSPAPFLERVFKQRGGWMR